MKDSIALEIINEDSLSMLERPEDEVRIFLSKELKDVTRLALGEGGKSVAPDGVYV